ncbi:hypothetical protein FHG87_017649 [Trinorchestia longiramus]|nr:hypothetical protein FHG87_017649 [Trinorchestia longiramus]
MNNIPIETVQQQRDLGAIVTENLKHDKQVEKSVKNASRILHFNVRNLEYKSKNIILPHYKTLVRPHLESAVQLTSPTLRRDINNIEQIQRKAKKMIPELHNFSYERRLQHLELVSLEQRRLRGQLIDTCNYRNGLSDVTLDELIERDGNMRTKNNGQKLILRNLDIPSYAMAITLPPPPPPLPRPRQHRYCNKVIEAVALSTVIDVGVKCRQGCAARL